MIRANLYKDARCIGGLGILNREFVKGTVIAFPRSTFILLLLGFVLVLACAQPEPTPTISRVLSTPNPTATLAPTAVPTATGSPTMTPTATSGPTPTTVPPTPAPTPASCKGHPDKAETKPDSGYFQQPHRAYSDDGFTFVPERGSLLVNVSVPDAGVRPDGEV